MIRKAALTTLTAVAMSVLLTAGSCTPGDPCASLPAPSPAEVDTVRQGGEVEHPGDGGAECDLEPDGTWAQDVDHHKTKTKPTKPGGSKPQKTGSRR